MRPIMMAKLRAIAALVLAVAGLATAVSHAAALERGMFGWRTTEVTGTRPLLVIWVREADAAPADELAKYHTYFQDTVFGRGGTLGRDHFDRSVVSYYREVSNGKFTWSRAGLIGPLNAEIKGKPAAEIARLAIEAASVEGGVAFRDFDTNHDGRIAPEELGVLVITNVPAPGRRWIDFTPANRNIALPAEDVTFAGRAAVVGENDGFAAINRQLFRLLAPDAVDLDGWPQKCFALNSGRSLMSAANTGNPALTVHLDAWHKMMVGWTEPRVFVIGKPGAAKLAAQYVAATEADLKRPVLLFDPERGPREFFLLEYRAHSPLGFDQGMANSGIVVWQVVLDGANRPFPVPADRANCKGETLQVPSLFVRGPRDWTLGGNGAYGANDGPFSLKWLDGQDTGVRVTAGAVVSAAAWRTEITWTGR
jgi:hypothetical protein